MPAASSSNSTSSSSSSFTTWLSDNIDDFAGYLAAFVVLTVIAIAICWYFWPERTKKVLKCCCLGSLTGLKSLLLKAVKKGRRTRDKKGDESDSDSDSGDDADEDEDGGKRGKSKRKKGKAGSSDDDDDDDVDPKVWHDSVVQ